MKFGFSHAALRGLLASSRARRWQRALGGADEMLAPCRPVTAEPGHHWFGYYDKLLEHSRMDCPLVALAFECQMFPEIPTMPHDIFMDKIITEAAVYERQIPGRRGE